MSTSPIDDTGNALLQLTPADDSAWEDVEADASPHSPSHARAVLTNLNYIFSTLAGPNFSSLPRPASAQENESVKVFAGITSYLSHLADTVDPVGHKKSRAAEGSDRAQLEEYRDRLFNALQALTLDTDTCPPHLSQGSALAKNIDCLAGVSLCTDPRSKEFHCSSISDCHKGPGNSFPDSFVADLSSAYKTVTGCLRRMVQENVQLKAANVAFANQNETLRSALASHTRMKHDRM